MAGWSPTAVRATQCQGALRAHQPVQGVVCGPCALLQSGRRGAWGVGWGGVRLHAGAPCPAPPTHRCLGLGLVVEELPLPDGVVQLGVGVAVLALVDEQLKALSHAGHVAVPDAGWGGGGGGHGGGSGMGRQRQRPRAARQGRAADQGREATRQQLPQRVPARPPARPSRLACACPSARPRTPAP